MEPALLYSEICPPAPTLTMARLGRVSQHVKFTFDTPGMPTPAGQAVTCDVVLVLVAVRLRTTALALAGTVVAPPVTASCRCSLSPNGWVLPPVPSRVSSRRLGVSPVKPSPTTWPES